MRMVQPFTILNVSGVLAPAAIAIVAMVAEAAPLNHWNYDPQANQLEVTVPTGVKPRYFLMAKPARIVLDIPKTVIGQEIKSHASYPGTVRQINVSQVQEDTVRIIMELAPGTVLQPKQAKLEQATGSEGQDRWILRPLLAKTQPSSPRPASVAPAAVPPPSPVQPAVPPSPTVPPTAPAPIPFGTQLPPTPDRSSSVAPIAPPILAGDQFLPSPIPPQVTPPSQAQGPAAAPISPPIGAVTPPPGLTVSASPVSLGGAEPESPDAPEVAKASSPPIDQDLAIDTSKGVAIAVPPAPADSQPTAMPALTIANQPLPPLAPILDSAGVATTLPNPIQSSPPQLARPLPEIAELPSPIAAMPTSQRVAVPSLAPILPSEQPGVPSAPVVSVPPLPTGSSLPIASPLPVTAPPRPFPSQPLPPGDLPLAPSLPSPIGRPLVPLTTRQTTPTLDTGAGLALPNAMPLGQQFGRAADLGGTTTLIPGMLPSGLGRAQTASPPAFPTQANPQPALPSLDNATLPPVGAGTPTVSVPPLSSGDSSPANSGVLQFGQPLPPSPGPIAAASPSPSWAGSGLGMSSFQSSVPGVLLPNGTMLSLVYPGETTAQLPTGQPRQDVLLLQTEVRDAYGRLVLPQGTPVLGRFETDVDGSRFVTQAISVQGRTIPLAARSQAIAGTRKISEGQMALYSGAGALAGGLVSGFSGWGFLGGAAAGAAVNYFTAPRPAVLQPGQIVLIQVTQDVR